MESVEVSHKQSDMMLIVYFALLLSDRQRVGADLVMLLRIMQPDI